MNYTAGFRSTFFLVLFFGFAIYSCSSDKSFFLSVGYYRPHLPFNALNKYWDMYKLDEIGRLPSALERLGLRENTIVVLWGDHGWKLGEHNGWCKQTTYEIEYI